MADWYYRRQGVRFGPVSLDELRRLVMSDRLDASDPVSQDGVTDWRATDEVEGLFLPPPLPPRQTAVAMAVARTSTASANEDHRLLAGKENLADAIGDGQPQATPDVRISVSRRPPLGSSDYNLPKRKPGFKQVATIGGCAIVVLYTIYVALLSGTSGNLAKRPSESIEQDFAKAQDAFSRSELRPFFQGMDRKRLAVWKEAAEKGMPEAELLHGHVLLYGVECKKAPEEALSWFRKAADQGNAFAQFALGGCYQYGQSQDLAEAVKWYRMAAEQGYAPAQTALAGSYDTGRGVPKDHAEALKWYRMAAERGDAQAQCNMGIFYDKGEGVPQDYTEMAKWFCKAAKQGYAEAQHNLGVCYERGEGVPQDYTEMLKWYQMAAERGYARSQFNLGNCYEKGRGTSQDHAEAVKWLRKAAEQGYAPAQDRLTAMGESFEQRGTVDSHAITCAELAKYIAALCGESDIQVAQSPKPGYDVCYMFHGGNVRPAEIFKWIGKPDKGYEVKTGEFGYVGEQEWIYHCRDGELCLQLCRSPNSGCVVIPNVAVHSRSR